LKVGIYSNHCKTATVICEIVSTNRKAINVWIGNVLSVNVVFIKKYMKSSPRFSMLIFDKN